MIKRFQKYANVLPIISKADSYKTSELLKFKLDIITTAADRGVKFFDCEEAITQICDFVSFNQIN
jgi:septin family protein